MTANVLHCLKLLRHLDEVQAMGNKAASFVLSQREASGFWRFIGEGAQLPPDVDTSSCAFVALKLWGIAIDYEQAAKQLLRYRLDEGAFWTWILDREPGGVEIENDIDWVVNANAVFCLSGLGCSSVQTERFLEEIFTRNLFQGGSIYYPSSLSFVYCLTRAIVDGGAAYISRLLPKIAAHLSDIQRADGSFGDCLENALGTVSLVNCGGSAEATRQAILNLLSQQQEGGSWEVAPFFTEPAGHCYGSRALTTAVAVEAVAKYLAATKGFYQTPIGDDRPRW